MDKKSPSMRKPKVYLETTLFNFYVDESRDAHADTVKLFQEIAAGKYAAFTSTYVTDELENAPEEKRDRMMSLITEHDITVLAPNDEAVRIADIYVAQGVIPQKYRTDGLHIAIATVNELDMIISMNFQHIVKRKTVLMTGHINMMQGYRAIEIHSPMEVIDNENA
jgi:predicted nucleic acid-binding protein